MIERSTKGACLHHGLVQQRKRAAMRGVVVQGQCRGCRKAIGPRVLVDRNSTLATRAPFWLSSSKSPKTKKRRAYAAALKTRRWQELRLERLALDSYICASCGGVADQVHHVSYEGLGGEESIEQLVSCCAECNQAHRSASITRAVLG